MRRGTTPTLKLTTNVDLTGCEVHVAIRQGQVTLRKSGDALEVQPGRHGSAVYVTLTQDETLNLAAGKTAQVQMRFTGESGAAATKIREIRIEDVLEEEVI